MKTLLMLFCATVSMFALAAPVMDEDGVPIVNIHGTIVKTSDAKELAAAKEYGFSVSTQRMITVGEKQMPLEEFLLTYCQGKFQNATCARGLKIARIDSFSGPTELLPKGL